MSFENNGYSYLWAQSTYYYITPIVIEERYWKASFNILRKSLGVHFNSEYFNLKFLNIKNDILVENEKVYISQDQL